MLIVLEGNDGSGKATQTKLLVESLREKGAAVETIDFPRYYDNFFGNFIGECLRGDHGNFVDLDPKIASMLYAFDRSESRDDIASWVREGKTVIADRYATANMIHQGGKIKDEKERNDFILWLETLEYEKLKLPRPDMVVYLDVPIETSLKNLASKKESYAAGKSDQHEGNREFLHNSRRAALSVAARDPAWYTVSCAHDGVMRKRSDIHREIIKLIQQIHGN